jgi:hypothetical protein
MRRRKLRVAVATASTVFAVQALALIPVAQADACTVTVKLITGQTLSFAVNAAPDTPISQLGLNLPAAVVSTAWSCAPPPTTTTTGSGSSSSSSSASSSTSTSTSSSSTSTTTTSSHTQTPPRQNGRPHQQHQSSHGQGSTGGNKGKGGTHTTTTTTSKTSTSSAKKKSSKKNKKNKKKKSGKGPSASNPSFSFALPGAAPIGVPNFFIDSFRIPPFLLPIYQAAGIQYDVPWQVLAGINEIETDYGRNLSVSSAGAVGWMQFLPETWKTWGLDANGDGVADPYNPVDAIFSAARYLHAAGASKDLNQAIFAYNHASWYVQSVLLRAKLIGGMPDQLIGALSGLVEGHFPVAAPAKYQDNAVTALAKKHVKSQNVAIPISSDPSSKAVSIFAKQNAPAIAVNDGKIVKVGENTAWGKFIQLQDQTGNIFTYAHLGSIPKTYPVPKPVKISAAELTKQLSTPTLPSPKAPASAGQQAGTPTVSTRTATKVTKSQQKITLPTTSTTANVPSPTMTTDAPKLSATFSQSSQHGTPAHRAVAKPAAAASPAPKQTAAQESGAQQQTTQAPMVKERLFADPSRPASYAAGGQLQLRSSSAKIASFQNYFSDVLHLGKNEYTLQPLKAGAVVVAGTILGRIAAGDQKTASHMVFMIQPAGKNAPQIDPKPILDGWKLLGATAVYRAAGVNPFFGPGAKNPTIGQILLMSKEQLQNRILQDPHVGIYACGRRDVQAGLVDRRVLATLEFLAASGLDPTVSGLICGHNNAGTTNATPQRQSAASQASGSSVDIAKINNIPVKGHQGSGSITDITIRRLLTLQGAMKPDQIISTMSYKGQANTLALPDHADRISVTFTPLFGANNKLSNQIKSILRPGQWDKLINRISQIPEPIVPIAPSKYAIKTATHGAH